VGRDPNPIESHRKSGYSEKKAKERVGGASGGLGA